jgi:hypothetical protein
MLMTLSWILAGKFPDSFSADLFSLTVYGIICPSFFYQQCIDPNCEMALCGVAQ